MSKRRFLLLIVLLTGLVLVGCTRSASEESVPEVTPTDLIAGYIERAGATQTALAAGSSGEGEGIGGGEGDLPEATNTAAPAGVATATPTVSSPTAVPVIPTVSVPATYTLQKGEHPYCIARRFNIDATALLNANGLGSGSVFSVGQVLTIPQDAGAFGAERALLPHPTTYTVVGGDDFSTIACKFGDVTPEAIAAANNLELDATLTVGQTLQIP